MEWARLSWRGDCCRDDRFRDVLYFQLWRCWNPVSCRQARLIMATYMKSLKISNSEIYIWSFLRQCRCWCACRLYGEFKIIKPVAHWFHNIFKQSCPCFEISKRTLGEYLLPMTNLWGFVLNWFVKVSLTKTAKHLPNLGMSAQQIGVCVCSWFFCVHDVLIWNYFELTMWSITTETQSKHTWTQCELKWYTDKAQTNTWKAHHMLNINIKVNFV